MTHKSPQIMKISPPLKKKYSSSLFFPTSPSVLNKVHAFNVKPGTPSFPVILATPFFDSCLEAPTLKIKSFLEKKMILNTTFSHSRRASLTFKKALSSERFTTHDLPTERSSATFETMSHKEYNDPSASSF